MKLNDYWALVTEIENLNEFYLLFKAIVDIRVRPLEN